MRAKQLDLRTPRMQAAIEELQRLIQQHYPVATFQVEPGDDPTGMYVLATVDGEDMDVVVDGYVAESGGPNDAALVRAAKRLDALLREARHA